MPSQVDDLSPAETWALARADQRRHNRTIRLVAWVLAWIPFLVYRGVSVAINHSDFGDGSADLKDVKESTILTTAPDYNAQLEEARSGR